MVTIRQPTPDDAAAITGIWLESWRVSYRGIVPDVAIARRTDEAAAAYWEAVLEDPARTELVLVAEDPVTSVIGFAQAGPCEPEEPGYDVELWKLYIAEAHHRRGVGRALMQGMADLLMAHGYQSLALRAFVGNRAAGFYERLGGQELRTEPYEILGEQVDTVLYGWPDLTLLGAPGRQDGPL
jgi:GNAT superfamily N-acetyltransferase